MLDIIYKELAEALTSDRADEIYKEKDTEAVTHIDLFNNQYLEEERECAYPLPAIFIEFASEETTLQQRLAEKITQTINIHIESTELGKTYQRGKRVPNLNKSLSHLRLISAVRKILKQYETDKFSTLIPQGRVLDSEHEGNPVHVLTFTTSHFDLDALPEYQEQRIGVQLSKSTRNTRY